MDKEITLLEQNQQAEQELDEAYKVELSFQLRQQARQHVVNWSTRYGQKFEIAAFSAVNGRWGDVKKDLERGRICKDELIRLLDKMQYLKLISQRQYDFYSGW